MPTYKVQGIILKRTGLGEADKIVTAFTDTLGKIKFVAKGVRRPKSKLAGSIEPFCLSELLLSTGRSLDILTSAQIKNNYLGLKPNLEEVKTAGIISEVIDKIIPEKMASTTIFNLLNETLSSITSTNNSLVKSYFEAKFLNLSGLFPETSLCIKCEEKPQDDIYFSNSGGGLVCDNCKNYFPDCRRVSKNAVKAIRFSAENSLQSFTRLNLTPDEKDSIAIILSDFTKHSFGRDFKAERI